MKKRFTFFGIMLACLTVTGSFAQVIISNSFEEWASGKPIGWQGSTTNMGIDSITQITEGTMYGASAVQIQNRSSSHKRFSSNVVTIENGVEYHFKYYVKGKGDIRAGLFDNDVAASDFGYSYAAYFSVNSSDWVEVNQSIISDVNTSSAQFIFSIRNTDAANNHLQIDSVAVTSSTVVPVSIYDIQFTSESSGDSPLVGQVVTAGGIITAVKSNPNGGFYVQAGTGAWSGIFVFDPDRSMTAAIGDSIILTGTIEEHFSVTQISQVSGYNKVSSGNTVPTAFVSTTTLLGAEAFENVLVRAMNAKATSIPNNFKVWPANDGSGQLLVDTVLFRYTPVVGRDYNITGVITFAFNTYRILPRMLSDIEDLVGFSEPSVDVEWSVYPNPSSGIAHLQCIADRNAKGTIRMMDLSGKLLGQVQVDLKPGVNKTDISKIIPGSGVYFLQFQSGNTNTTTRLIVQ